MAKPKTFSTMFTCELCGYKVSNHYIFKRHLHKCYTVHGIASKRSTSRNPMRINVTEGLASSESKAFDEVEDKAGKYKTLDNENGGEIPVKEGVDQHAPVSASFGDEEESIGSVSSQWGVTNSPQLLVDIATSDKKDGTNFLSEAETPSPTKARFERKYKCEICTFETLKSRNYLYHLRDVHGDKLTIFECHLCDYASRYNTKLARHMTVHKRPGEIGLTLDIDSSVSVVASQRLRVKPLKLKRLTMKKPSSLFEVSPNINKDSPTVTDNDSPNLISDDSPAMKSNDSTSRLSDASLTASGDPSPTNKMLTTCTKRKRVIQKSNSKQREVFKMIINEDGSHHYQCRSCLFYAKNSHSVKKHHSLCHSKILHCSYCSYFTKSQAEYYEHILIHGGTGKLAFIKCEDCSYVTNARPNYEKHRSFHGADFPFHCSVCNFAAESECKVKRHMATQHKNPSSDQDEDMSPEERQIISESLSKKRPSMEKQFSLDMGQNISAQDEDEGDFQDSRLLKYKCPECPIVCLRRGNFTRHLIARHQFTQTSASLTSKNMEKKMLRKRKRSGTIPSMLSAKKRRQILCGGENLKCSECSYTAKWPSDLRRHRQVHTLFKRFKCSLCINKYKYLGDLNAHIRRDHLTEPNNAAVPEECVRSEIIKKASPASFRCPICPFTTHSKAYLEQHSKQHRGIKKTFQCRICKYQTYWRGDVGRHLFRHHTILLGKDPQDIDTYFIHRPEIRPLTKQPNYNSLISPSSKKIIKTEVAHSDDQNLSLVQNEDDSGSPFTSAHKNPALISGKEGQFACNYPGCDFRTTTSDRLMTHRAYHENLKQFMCPTCGKRTNWKWDIVKHMNKVHRNLDAALVNVVTLSIEEARATIDEYLSKHQRKSAGISVYLCSLCDFKSDDKNRVVNHLSINHKDEENAKVMTKSMSKSYSSNNLMKASKEPSSMSETSLKTVTPNNDVWVDPPPEELAKIDKPFACAICKKAEISKAEVKKHYNYAHPYKEVHIIYTLDGTEFDYNTNEVYSRKSDHLQESEEQKFSDTALKTVRPDSKYSNPKMHGYVKPFKCSICGLRSNWKWDLKKHLRAKHPSDGGFVIMLSIEEAKSTFALECSPSHPKEAKLPVYKVSPKSEPVSKSDPFKHPSCVKGEPYDSAYGIFGSLKSVPSERGTNFDPNRRQWKCSGCNYISNWRRNMARHIQRHHWHERSKIRIIPLHLLSKNSQQKFMKAQLESAMKAEVEGTEEKSQMYRFSGGAAKLGADGSSKVWQCQNCPFQSTLRTHIIVHMQKHGKKPFQCGVCNIPFMNRGPLHRHIQKVHRRSDYVKLCKVNIDYGDGEHTEDVFICCLCQLESKDKFAIVSHIDQEHGVTESEYHIVRMQKKIDGSAVPEDSPSSASQLFTERKRPRKFHYCQLCPFCSPKKSMLLFHMTYHKPTPVNRLKCKYCPYYVSTTRLLHQHQRKWHTDNRRLENHVGGLTWDQVQTTPPMSPMKTSGRYDQTISTQRRLFCEKCPYTTNSKNDFIYHKQFHRPKRTAEYKCEYCDYWVVHKRLLKQHMRLHTKAIQQSNAEVSPAKSAYSDPGLVYDPRELTELAAIKQEMIAAKITPSLSKSPKFSPMKMATKLSVDNKPGYVLKNGLYRKLHKCQRCPYTNTRARNMQLHEMMHGPRQCSYPLMKCPYCDYYVGSKGLLSHHMKVHQKNYGDTPENDAMISSFGMNDDDDGSDTEIQTQQKVDTLLSISRFKRFGCEKCPYASAKRQHFERHLELHGSRQRYTCQYCDYSVPSSYLLTQHSKLHLMPNQNLLASQSINNLQHMSEVPADVALASALPPTDRDMPVTISVIHDHLGLYENSIYDSEPKKLYRCDRCPYANVRRDYLLSHLKFHMVPSSLVCPYCDYSAPKQALLIQHIRVHFCPLPELSDWLLENGQMERETNQRNIDLAEALKVAHEYQNQSKKKLKGGKSDASNSTVKDQNTEEKENVEEGQKTASQQTLICQYCDREFSSSEKLVKHELQHLIGNQFEMALKTVSEDQQHNSSGKKVSKFDSILPTTDTKKGDLSGSADGTKEANDASMENEEESLLKIEMTRDQSLNASGKRVSEFDSNLTTMDTMEKDDSSKCADGTVEANDIILENEDDSLLSGDRSLHLNMSMEIDDQDTESAKENCQEFNKVPNDETSEDLEEKVKCTGENVETEVYKYESREVEEETNKTENKTSKETFSTVTFGLSSKNNVSNEKENNVSDETENNVSNETENNVSNETENNVSYEIENNVSNETETFVSNETENNVSNEIENNVSNEPENNVSNEIENNVSNEIENNVSNETENKVSNETENNVSSEKENDVSNEKDEITDNKNKEGLENSTHLAAQGSLVKSTTIITFKTLNSPVAENATQQFNGDGSSVEKEEDENDPKKENKNTIEEIDKVTEDQEIGGVIETIQKSDKSKTEADIMITKDTQWEGQEMEGMSEIQLIEQNKKDSCEAREIEEMDRSEDKMELASFSLKEDGQ